MIQLFRKVLARATDHDAIERCRWLTVARNFIVDAGGVERVAARDDFEGERRIVDTRSEDADLIERRRESDEAKAAHATVCWLDANDAAERRRLSNRSTGFGAESDRRNARGDRRRGAA